MRRSDFGGVAKNPSAIAHKTNPPANGRGSSCQSRYPSNPYTNASVRDNPKGRYISPHSSSFDNRATTSSINFNRGTNEGSKSGAARTSSHSHVRKGSNARSSSSKIENKQSTIEEIIDYKALWEAAKLEHNKLKRQLKRKEDEMTQVGRARDRIVKAEANKNLLPEVADPDNKATTERRISKLKTELKEMFDLYKAENERLKEENGALINIINKLTKRK